MTILDLSKAPCTVTVTNTTAADMKISLSGHSQSFILSAGASAELQATTSSDLIGYLSQLRPGLTINFPGLASLGLIPGEYTIPATRLFTDGDMTPEGSVFEGSPFGLVEGQHYKLTYTIDGGSEIEVVTVAMALPISESESVLVCVGYDNTPPALVEGGANIIIADGKFLPVEEYTDDAFMAVDSTIGSILLLNASPEVDIAGSVINLLSFEETEEEITTPSATISTTVAGGTLTIVDADSNVYENLDTVPYGTVLTISGVADEGYEIDTFTINGSSVGGDSTTHTVEGDVEIVLTSRGAMFNLSINANGCTVVVADATPTEYVAGSNVIPVGTEVTITVSPEVGYSATGMLIVVDGNAINSGDRVIVNGDLSIAATALELFSVTHTSLVDANLTSLTISDGTTSYIAGTDSFDDILVDRTSITITAVANETTHTTTGMTFTVNGDNYTNGSSILVTGDLTLVLAAATL
jgi:hypothetical protein